VVEYTLKPATGEHDDLPDAPWDLVAALLNGEGGCIRIQPGVDVERSKAIFDAMAMLLIPVDDEHTSLANPFTVPDATKNDEDDDDDDVDGPDLTPYDER
jgi:hypothetical protein